MQLSDNYILYSEEPALQQAVEDLLKNTGDSEPTDLNYRFVKSPGRAGLLQANHDVLEIVIQKFERALEACDLEQASENWATIQMHLGAVLHILAQQQSDATLLKRSAEAYTHTLTVWTRDKAPLKWAASMNKLGILFHAQGISRKGSRTFEKSAVSFKNALAELSYEEQPLEWAKSYNNLGAVLQNLGEREDNSKQMELAIEAYENTLDIWREQQLPMDLAALTIANLGVARQALAELTKDAVIAERAVDDFVLVTEVFSSACDADYRAQGEKQYEKATALLEALEA